MLFCLGTSLRVYVYVCVYVCLCACVCMRVHTRAHAHRHTSVFMCTSVLACGDRGGGGGGENLLCQSPTTTFEIGTFTELEA